MPRQSGAGYGVQDPRPRRGEAAQSAILPGTARSRLCGKDGRGAVRLSPGENPQAGGGRVKGEEKARSGGDHLLRREAGHPGDRDDRPGFAARARRPFAREHEYKRHGTVSLLAGIDLVTGKVHALVKDRHRSREFIEFLKLLDAAYPADTAIKLILDNHSAHISKETRTWLADQPEHRFE